MTAYSELVKKFRAKNSKPTMDWRYESWGNPDVERIGMKPGGLVEPGVTHYATKSKVKGAGERLREEITEATNKKYADILKEKKIKGKFSDITDNKVKSQIRSLYHTREVNPYKKIGFSRSKKLIKANFKNFDKFIESSQTLEDFYELFKDRTFKLNLRTYLKGEAGAGITQAFDDLEFQKKYKNIIPKITEHLEAWHEREPDPKDARKKAKKKALIKKYSSSEVETLINQAKATKLFDYANRLDLAHRQELNMDLNLSELGIEKPEINQVLIKSAELERNKLQSKNIKLINEIKQGKNVQKNMELIAQNNDRIKAIAKMTNGRLLGVTTDLETLKPVKIKPNSVSSVDANLWNKPIKEFATDQKAMLEFKNKVLPQIIDEARTMTPEKIASELSGIMQDETLSKKLAADIEKLAPDKPGYYPLKAKSQEVYKLMAAKIAEGPEGIKFLNKQATAQTMWKLVGDKAKDLCSEQKVAGGGRIGFQGRVCGLKFATDKPTEFMAAVKKNKEALNAFKVASKSNSKILKAARWVMRDLGNPVGWIGSELIISGGITAAMLSEGYTTREAIDSGIAWFLPKSVLKAELHKIRDMAEKEGVDFETLMPFLELEIIAEEHDKAQQTYLKNTSPFYAWSPQNLQQISFKMFGKKLENLTEEELKQIPMPSASGQGGEFYRKQAIDSSVLGMGTANKKYSDLLRKIQKPFGKDDLRYALPYSQLDELRNVADMAQTEKAKANELAALKSQYDRGMQYTKGQGKQTSFQDWVHQQGKGDLFFNEFQRGPDRREMLTWGLFHDVGKEPYKMPFPEKAPIDFSAAPYEAGGRVAFGGGGIDKGRRAFMKWLAGITGAGVAGATGLLKWGKIGGKGTTAIKAGDKIIQGTPGMPDWFIPLVNRIVKEGDDVTKKLGTVEREIVHTKKIAPGEEVTVYQDMNTGNVRVDYTSPHIMGEGSVGPVQLEYRAGEIITEGKHAGKKTKPEFTAVESEPVGRTSGPDDYSIEWDGENVVGRVEDLMSDTNKLKQFAKKKKATMGDIVESSKKKKAVQKVHENESDYIVSKQGDYDDYLPDIDDIE